MKGYIIINFTGDDEWTFINNSNFRKGLSKLLERDPEYFAVPPDDFLDVVWENGSWNLTKSDLKNIVNKHIEKFCDENYALLEINNHDVKEIQFCDI